jgi:hypothetical protein
MMKLIFSIVVGIVMTTLFCISIYQEHIGIAALLWVVSGAVSFQLVIGVLFEKWTERETKALFYFMLFGLVTIWGSCFYFWRTYSKAKRRLG